MVYTRKITCADIEPGNREATKKLNREIIWKSKQNVGQSILLLI
jgi:hypothetical protein